MQPAKDESKEEWLNKVLVATYNGIKIWGQSLPTDMKMYPDAIDCLCPPKAYMLRF